MLEQLPQFQEQLKKIEQDLQSPVVLSSPKELKNFSREFQKIKKIVDELEKLEKIQNSLKEAEKILGEENEELGELAKEEIEKLIKEKKDIEEKIKELLTPADPIEKRDIIVEIRAGVGGDEAELFAGDLFRMYSRYAERKNWKINLISSNPTSIGGLKEIIFEINGENVYRFLKYESGVHRVQRIPATEKSGRIHTSTASVAIMPKAEEIDIQIKNEGLRFDTFLSSGPGGQGVQTTYSGVRVTHLPTNTVITCQTTRSQIKNKEMALKVLRARLYAAEQEKREKEQKQTRQSQIGGAMRSEKIRTYNFPQDRVTDHRIQQSWHTISNILDGDLDKIINDLKKIWEKNKKPCLI